MEISMSVFGKHKMAMEISMAIFFYKYKMAMEISMSIFGKHKIISMAIFLTNTKWPWKFPRPFFFYKH